MLDAIFAFFYGDSHTNILQQQPPPDIHCLAIQLRFVFQLKTESA